MQCERLSDRMPGVALGRSEWSPDERHHLDNCADCQAEWELVRLTGRLGASMPETPDPDAISAAVLGRLAGDRAVTRTRRRNWLVAGLAAAAVAIVAVRIPRPPAGQQPVAPAPAPSAAAQILPLPELEDLPVSELQSILGSLDESSSATPSLDGSAGLDDLDDHELERVLDAWEG